MALLLFGILALAGAVPLLLKKRDKTTIPYRGAGIAMAIFAVLLLLGSVVRIVPPRSVGVEVTLGRVTDAFGSGLHFTLPWSSVERFPATIQTTRLQGGGQGDTEDGPCVTVRLGNQTTACVNVTTQWTVNTADTEAVKALYTRWRSFENIEPNLVRPQIQHSLLAPFEDYDPLRVLQTGEGSVTPSSELETAARKQLEQAVGNGITITALTINLVNYDQTTQDKLNAYAQAVADTRIAEQRKATADAQRQANEALAGSASSRDAGVLYQNCIDMTERLTKEGKTLPAAWSCSTSAQTVVPVR